MNRIAFIGGGNMARSLIGGLLQNGADPSTIAVAEPQAEARDALAREFGVTTHEDNTAAVEGADSVVLAVKPQVLPKVCASVADVVKRGQPLVVSIAAGIRIEQIERWLDSKPAVVRCMPNTPSLIGAGATGLCANSCTSEQQRAQAQHILDAAGITVWIEDEAQMDTVTAISGSAPAYFFLMVEALEQAAIAQGLPADSARRLAAQTCLGAGRMMTELSETADVLRKRVTSPGGTTQAALESFAADDLRGIVARAVAAASQRGAELADAND